MNNLLLFIAGLLVVVFAALFAVPTMIDWNGYRGIFEEEASKVLGRDVRVGGGVNLRLLPAPYVRFEKVRLADVSGNTGEPFVRAESFTMWLSAPALLRGVLEASKVELDQPVLTLALDETGSGNWSTIALNAGDLPFVPRDLALRSVDLRDGAISLYAANAERIARIDNIDGELSAEGLRGPFHFKGTAAWGGVAHDVKFATTQPAADGSFRLKAAVRPGDGPSNYLFDGAVENFSGKPSIKGKLTGRVAVPGVDIAPDRTVSKTDGARAQPSLALNADLTADAGQARLENLTLQLEESAAPQLLTGTASASWLNNPRTDVALASKWLDLDLLAGASTGEDAPFSRVRKLGQGLMATLLSDGAAHTRLVVDQVKVGGETAGTLNIDAERSDGQLKITRFQAGLPGSSRLNLDGVVRGISGKTEFAGSVSIRGTSLARLKEWAGKAGANIEVSSDGAYAADGQMTVAEDRVEITDATIDLGGTPLSGALRIVDGPTRAIDVTLEGQRIDTREFYATTAKTIRQTLNDAIGISSDEPAPPSTGETPPSGDAAAETITFRLLAAELVGENGTINDVDALLRLKPGDTVIERGRFSTPAGLSVSATGRIRATDDGRVGTLSYDLSGDKPEAVADAARLFALSDLVAPGKLAGLKNVRIAGLVNIGGRAPGSADLTFDGLANGASVKGFANFDGGIARWREDASRLALAVDAPSLSELVPFLGADAVARADEGESRKPARAHIASDGPLGDGAALRIDVASADFAAAYEGRLTLPVDAGAVGDGSLKLKIGDARHALMLLGYAAPAGMAGTTADGSIEIAYGGDGWHLKTRALSVGLSSLSGSATITPGRGNGQPGEVHADLTADHVSLIGLLSAISDKAPVIATNETEALPAERSLWPAGLFNFTALGTVSGEIALGFDVLDVTGDVATGPGRMKIVLAPARMEVADLSAAALGGTVTASAGLEKGSDGVTLKSKLDFAQADLSKLSARAGGTADVSVSADAKAQSPAGLIAVMTGSGTIRLVNARLPATDAAPIAAIAESVLAGQTPNDFDRIAEALTAAVSEASTDVGARDVEVTIANGAVKLSPITVAAPAGQLDLHAAVDLASMTLTTTSFAAPVTKPLPPPATALPGWQPKPTKGSLPAVVVTYNGSLDDTAALKALVDANEFYRELTARQIERNVDELERLRLMDQERARQQAVRRQSLDQKRDSVQPSPPAANQSGSLPPVLPESHGASQAPPQPQPEPAPIVPPPDAEPSANAEPLSGGAVPQAGPNPAPATPREAAVERGPKIVSPRPRPAPTSVERPRDRSPSDAVTRSLGGGFP